MSRRGGRVLLCHRHAKPCSIMTDVVVPKRATSLPGRMPTAGAGVFLQTILIWKQTLTSWYVHKTQPCGNRGGRGGLTLRAFIGLLLEYGCGCGCSCGAVTGEHTPNDTIPNDTSVFLSFSAIWAYQHQALSASADPTYAPAISCTQCDATTSVTLFGFSDICMCDAWCVVLSFFF